MAGSEDLFLALVELVMVHLVVSENKQIVLVGSVYLAKQLLYFLGQFDYELEVGKPLSVPLTAVFVHA